jgi:adenylosuccinate lyase
MSGWAGQGRFIDLVAADKEITKYLSSVEIAECFDVKYYFRHVDKIYKRCLG